MNGPFVRLWYERCGAQFYTPNRTFSAPFAKNPISGGNEPDPPEGVDTGKLVEAALAIISLTVHDDGRVWKGLDWNLMDLMVEKGWTQAWVFSVAESPSTGICCTKSEMAGMSRYTGSSSCPSIWSSADNRTAWTVRGAAVSCGAAATATALSNPLAINVVTRGLD